MQDQTDEAIVRLVQEKDKESFGVLIERYEGKLTRYVKRFVWDEDELKDLLQTVFIKAYVNIKSFDTNERFSPWIYRIAHNECVNFLKKKGRSKMSLIDVDLIFPNLRAEETADAETMRQEVRGMLEVHLNALPLKYKEVIVLHYFEDLSYEEIADILHIPPSTIGVRLMRGRALLKQMVPHTT